MTTITRKIEFDAGHRIYGHESKCANIHGHRYVVEITCQKDEGDLDNLGRVVDFSVVKELCGGWVDAHLDHGMLLYASDPLVDIWRTFGNEFSRKVLAPHTISDRVHDIDEQKHYIMDDNPTAENIARLLFEKFSDLLSGYDISVLKIVVYETPNCWSSYER